MLHFSILAVEMRSQTRTWYPEVSLVLILTKTGFRTEKSQVYSHLHVAFSHTLRTIQIQIEPQSGISGVAFKKK